LLKSSPQNHQTPSHLGRARSDGLHAHVLLALPPGVEREALALTLSGAHIPAETCDPAQARVMVELAAQAQAPFTLIVGDGRGAFEELAGALRAARVGRPGSVRAAVVIDAGDKTMIEPHRAAGVEGYLIRPIRPASLLQLCAPIAPQTKPATGQTPQPNGQGLKASGARRVLLAEDNDVNALIAMRMLAAVGCEVERVRNGQEAVDAVEVSMAPEVAGFDLVLMDVQMPVMDGLAATETIRARFVNSAAIVAITANAFAEDRAACLAAGMCDYLSKPFERAELLAILDTWASRPMSVNTCGDAALQLEASRHRAALKG
jgi:two-component system, sensor histidine kinase and response regulator